MGLSFKKELILDRTQIYPPESRAEESKLQSRLLQKLGDGAIPFTLEFPDLAPNSVLICADESEDPANRTMGVFYDVRVHLAESSDDYQGKKSSTVAMGIRKAQFAPSEQKLRSPASTAEKGVIFSYSIKVKLMLGGMGGELETDLPFKLCHPHPDSEESLRLDSEKKSARAKHEAKRKKFQNQDSVISEKFASKDETLEAQDG